MAPVEELDGLIQSMQALKAPGVSKPKVDAITALCRENIQVRRFKYLICCKATDITPLSQSEGLLVQKIYTSFSRAAPNYKLGVVYVVDSVSRDWVNHIRKADQTPHTGSASEGTFQAGIQKMSDILPSLMKQLFNVAPENQEVSNRRAFHRMIRTTTVHASCPISGLVVPAHIPYTIPNARCLLPESPAHR
jgi:protein NRD1